jgi:hypothetical protein
MSFWPIATAALAAFHATTAQPLHAVALQSNIFVERTSVGADGHERRVLAAPSKLGEGDSVIFLVRYRNTGAAPVSNVALVSPVPRSVRIDADRPDLLVSVDGGARWGRLSDLSVRTPLGGTRRAVAEDITHIRWSPRAPIAPGEAGQLSYRGTVRQ